jgi:diadenosine tetraphosphate (Ap4A) HIT family hydrolase
MSRSHCSLAGSSRGSPDEAHEDERTLAFMDINLITPGHALVIEAHRENVLS